MSGKAYAFIDESGQRSLTAASSDYFVLGAVVILDKDLPQVTAEIATLRTTLGRQPNQHLHWVNIRGLELRQLAIQGVASMPLVATTLVISKRHLLPDALGSEDRLYMYALKMLLERISWWGLENNVEVSYTLAHISRFRIEVLREYERVLKEVGGSGIEWGNLDPSGGSVDQPQRIEYLQIADFVASATALAFETNRDSPPDHSYLMALKETLYCPDGKKLSSYGLKIFPWDENTRAAHPWVAAL